MNLQDAKPGVLEQSLRQGFDRGRPGRPVLWFAAFGVLCTLYGLVGIVRWIVSADFAPIDPGPDPLPATTYWLIMVAQTVGVVGAVAVLVHVWKTCRREGRLSFEAALVFGLVLCYWQDPMINWYRPIFFYNSHFLNFGNWSQYLPGWVSPGSSGLPEPLLGMGLAYIYAGLWVALAVRGAMRMARNRKPQLSNLQLVLVALATGIAMDLVIETALVRFGLWAYPGAVGFLTLWAGETYQFPVYESVFWGPVWGAWGALYYFRDDRSHTVTERGIEEVKSRSMYGLLRVMAMTGALNLLFVGYNAGMMWMSFYVDSTPASYPSYLLNKMCGRQIGYECPGPEVPVFLRDSKPLPGLISGKN